jgi:UDP-N-acetyl-D-mannosaminuronic acid dehydrogenase
MPERPRDRLLGGKMIEKICVLGLGYIGLPTASMFASCGLQVIGVDVNTAVVSTLNNGGVHIEEPGLRELVHEVLTNGTLRFSSQVDHADAFIIAVPTPFNPDKTADLRAVTSATQMIVPYLAPGNLVVLESTSPPMTTLNLVKPILESSGLQAGKDFHLVYSPERVLPGKILQELVENARVIGGIDSASAEHGRTLYAHFVKGEIVLTKATTAEMVKLMENTYRDVNIAIANEFSRLADRFNIDIWEAISLANRHPRVNILKPGPGVGGHCISVDPWFLVEAAPELSELIKTARQVNDSQPHFVLDLIRRALGELQGRRVAVLGLSYKANVDDLRESPAVEITRLLVQAGALVKAYEPFKPFAMLEGVTAVPSLEAAVGDAQALVLLVGHQFFQELKPVDMARLTPARIVVDVVNGWKKDEWMNQEISLYRFWPNY